MTKLTRFRHNFVTDYSISTMPCKGYLSQYYDNGFSDFYYFSMDTSVRDSVTNNRMRTIDRLLKKYGSYSKVADAYKEAGGQIEKQRIHYWNKKASDLWNFINFILWAKDDLQMPSEYLVKDLEEDLRED